MPSTTFSQKKFYNREKVLYVDNYGTLIDLIISHQNIKLTHVFPTLSKITYICMVHYRNHKNSKDSR